LLLLLLLPSSSSSSLSSSSSSSSSLITVFLSPGTSHLNQWCNPPLRLQVSCSTFLVVSSVPRTEFIQ
jgi:hypothetical protein